MTPSTPPCVHEFSTPQAPRFAPTFDESRLRVTRRSTRRHAPHSATTSTTTLDCLDDALSPLASHADLAPAAARGRGRSDRHINPEMSKQKHAVNRDVGSAVATPEGSRHRKRSASDIDTQCSVSSSDDFTPRKRHTKYDTPSRNPLEPHSLTNRTTRSQKVQIYTDPNERIPELDTSPSNPFIGPSTGSTSALASANSFHKSDADVEMERAANNNEGMIWVFRGQKFLRRWDSPIMAGSSSQAVVHTDGRDIHNQTGLRIAQHMGKSSLQPRRLLFTPAETHNFTNVRQMRSLRRGPEEEDLMADLEGDSSNADTVSSAGSESSQATGSTHCEVVDAGTDAISYTAEPRSSTAMRPRPSGTTYDSPATNTRSRSTMSSPFDHWPRTKSRASSTRSRSEKTMSSQESTG